MLNHRVGGYDKQERLWCFRNETHETYILGVISKKEVGIKIKSKKANVLHEGKYFYDYIILYFIIFLPLHILNRYR